MAQTYRRSKVEKLIDQLQEVQERYENMAKDENQNTPTEWLRGVAYGIQHAIDEIGVRFKIMDE